MHELGVVFHVIDSVKKLAAENEVSHVSAVTLEIGEVSGVVHDQLRDCWNWAVTRHEIMNGCEVIIETIPAVTHCDGCDSDYPTVAHGKICPNCGSEATWLKQGREFAIKEMEVV